MSLESEVNISRRDFLAFLGTASAASAISMVPREILGAETDYRLVVNPPQLPAMVARMLGLDPNKVSDYFSDITPGKIQKKKTRTLNDLWEGDQVKFLLEKVPADKRQTVEARLKEFDKNYEAESDGLFTVKPGDYENAVRQMSHGHLNGEALNRGYRILTLYHMEKSFDGTVRRFVKGGEPKNDEIGTKEGAIYQAVRTEDVASAMKKLEGKYVFGLGKLFDNHPDVAKAFADYVKTAQVGLKNPLDEHYVVDKDGRLHRLEDKATWKYADQPIPSGPVPAAPPAARAAPVLPAPGTPERVVLAKVYDLLIWGPGFETPTTFEGQLGTPIYKPRK